MNLGDCPNKCGQLRYYDGCLGYEAARCDVCGYERDLNAKANGNPPEGETPTQFVRCPDHGRLPGETKNRKDNRNLK